MGSGVRRRLHTQFNDLFLNVVMSTRKQKLKRSQSVPIAVSKEAPCLKRYRTVSPTQKEEILGSPSEDELDPYAAAPGSQDSETMLTPSVKNTKKKQHADIFSPAENFQGHNRETLDELNYLLDGIKDTHPLSVRHSSLLTLVNLLADPHAFRLICLNGSLQSMFTAMLCNLQDPLFQTALLTSAYLATAEKSNLKFLGEEGANFLLLLITGGQMATKSVSEEVATPSKLMKGRPISKRHRNSSSGSGSVGKIVQDMDFFKIVMNTRQWNDFTAQSVSHKLLALWTLVKGAEDLAFRSILIQIDLGSKLIPLIDADSALLLEGDLSGKERLNYHLGILEQLANGNGSLYLFSCLVTLCTISHSC